MSKHAPEWSPEPRTIEPAIASANDLIESRLPLSDDTNRVLRASDVHDWGSIVDRLDTTTRNNLLAIAKAVI